VYRAGATILGQPRGYLGRWAKGGDNKYNCVLQKITNVHQKGMNMMKVNETHDHAVHEKIKVLHYIRFADEGLIFFLLIPIPHTLRKLCRNLA